MTMAAAAIMGGASLAAGIGTSLYAGSQNRRAQNTALQATKNAPDYRRTMLDALKAQGKIAGRQFDLESQFQPKYADLQAQVQGQLGQVGMQQAGQMYNQAADIENQYLRKVRTGDIAQLNTLLPQYKRAFEALYPGSAAASEATGQLAAQSMQSALQRPQLTAFEAGVGGPQLESGLGTIDQGLVEQYMGAQPGVSGIASQLAQQAQADLTAGRSLTPEEERMSQQSARQAYASRGMAMGPQSMAAEILNQNQLANQRYQQRQQAGQQIAGTISNLYQPALQQTFQRQAGAEQFNLGAQGQAFQQALQRGQAELGRLQGETAVQAGRAQLGSMAMQQLQQQQQPLLNAFYRTPLLANLPGQQQQMALQSQAAMGPGLFNPESQMAFQSAFLPYQARQAAALGGVQQTAANNASMMGIVGSGMQMAGQLGATYGRNQALNTPAGPQVAYSDQYGPVYQGNVAR